MIHKKMNLFYILKLNTSNIINNNYLLDVSFKSAKENGLIISLGDNQLLRFIRQIKNKPFNKSVLDDLYEQRNFLKKQESSKENSLNIIKIQNKINELLFVPDIVSIKVDTTKKDYKYLCKNGFTVKIKVNKKVYECKYKRLCAGAGQLRRNSAIFVDEKLYDKLESIMMCGLTKNSIGKINLAKFGAYFALYTSATNEVTVPKICVIPDYEITLKNEPISWIYSSNNNEFNIQNKNIDLAVNAFDGSGIVSPRMAEQWQKDLNLDYLPSSFIIRGPWLKGLCSVFDFHRFAKEIAHTDKIKDLWGVEYKVSDIDVILTASQFKLYKRYSNWQQYMFYFKRFNHVLGISRVNKKENDFLSTLNYQYIQSNNFTEKSIKQLSEYTISWLKRIMQGDKLSAMLLLGIQGEEDDEINKIENKLNSSIAKVLMYNDSILDDSYVRSKLIKMIETKINQAKIGKLYVEGSYDFAIPDLYALCEWAFGLDVNGLLLAKYSYNKRWVDKDTTIVSVQRSPLVAPAENRTRHISLDDKCKDWFSYLKSGMVMSIKDADMIAASDADYDGDILMVSDNPFLIDAIGENKPLITYDKQKAPEKRLSYLGCASIDTQSFDTKIGFITNLASNFIAMLNSYKLGSKEYIELKKRVDLLRFYQGSEIDKTKGNTAIPPPKHWSKKQKYIPITQDMTSKEKHEAEIKNRQIAFDNRICGDKKPYFFAYVYPKYYQEYIRHRKNYKKMCELMFNMSIYELSQKKNKTQKEILFLKRYYKYMPLLNNNCIMNILCRHIEDVEFDNKWKINNKQFDYKILMSKDFSLDDKILYNKIDSIVKEFNRKYTLIIKEKSELLNADGISLDSEDEDEFNTELSMLIQDYENKILSVCSNAPKITDYLIDIYYTHYKNSPKILLWGQFGEFILNNVKGKSNTVTYPILDENGQDYLGRKYLLKEVTI